MFGFGILAGMFVLMTGTILGGWEIQGRLRSCVTAISVAGVIFVVIGHFIASRKTEPVANETGGERVSQRASTVWPPSRFRRTPCRWYRPAILGKINRRSGLAGVRGYGVGQPARCSRSPS